MSVLEYIRHTMPEPIEKACLKFKKKDETVKRIYAMMPIAWRNKYHYRCSISRVNSIFYSIMERGIELYKLIDMTNVSSVELAEWILLSEEIKQNIEDAR